MTETQENVDAVQAVMRRLAGRFGGGYALGADYLTEMSRALLEECPTVDVFRAVSRELLSMAPTDQNGNRRVPTPYDVALLVRSNVPPPPECEQCEGSGWLSRDEERWSDVAMAMIRVPVARRCPCGTVYRLPKDGPTNATMADIAGLVRAAGGGR